MTIAPNLYERDFYAWLMHNAALIRKGHLTEIDAANVAEELESMGRSERHELINRLAVLLAHLLKWQMQPKRRGKSWRVTIEEQRRRVKRRLKDSPSLQADLVNTLTDAYGDAVLKVIKQTPFEKKDFPSACPFTVEQILDDDFWPLGSAPQQ